MQKAKRILPKVEVKNDAVNRSGYVSQQDIPRYALEQALVVPKAIIDNYAGTSVNPLKVAKALGLSPTSSHFKMICGSAIAYGLTTGGYNAAEIKVEPLAKKILSPRTETDELEGKREAFLKPRVTGGFLKKYNGSPIPRDDIAHNVLAEEFGVPRDRCKEVFGIIIQTSEKLGVISQIKDKKYVDLDSTELPDDTLSDALTEDGADVIDFPKVEKKLIDKSEPNRADPEKARRVFITHGKNQAFLEPIKKLLQFGELTPVVSVEKQSASVPVPEKVMTDMRSCGAAIIHVDAEEMLIDESANKRAVLNSNVLIEIGAAMALYGKRFILLVKDGIKLPSNLQGLFEVRYGGDALDGTVTIKLLEAINEMKKHPIVN